MGKGTYTIIEKCVNYEPDCGNFCHIGHPLADGSTPDLDFGVGCLIRSNSVIYAGSYFGNWVKTGHHVVVREYCDIGNNTVIGTGVKIENNAVIGNNVLIETQSHITAFITIEDYVFIGAGVITTNDKKMLHGRIKPPGFTLRGATIKRGARIGSGAVILPGVIIGANSVVAANELVRKDVPAGKMLYKGRIFSNVSREEWL